MLLLPLHALIHHDLSSNHIVNLFFLCNLFFVQVFAALVILDKKLQVSFHVVFAALDSQFSEFAVLFISQIWPTTCDCGLFPLLVVNSLLFAVFSHLLTELFLQFSFAKLIFFLLQPGNIVADFKLHLKVFILELRQNSKLF